MNKQIIEEALKAAGISCSLHLYDTIDSTNNRAKKLALDTDEISVVIAEHQTSGRGRLGRTFFSPDKTGLYMSIVIHPELSAEDTLLITPATAVAVSDVMINELQKNVQIKWVNDIYLDKKKICGILTESAFDKNGKIQYAVVGIGINIAPPENDFPAELVPIAGTLFDKIPEDLELLCAKIIASTINTCTALPDRTFLNAYRERQMLTGKTVTLPTGEDVKVIGIDDCCGLLIEYENGKTASVKTGEVSVKLK